MIKKGKYALLNLGRILLRYDPSGNRHISYSDFSTALEGFRLNVPDWVIDQVFVFFDEGNNGYINYDEFLLGVRGPLSELRMKCIAETW